MAKKQYAILGLGIFGSTIAKVLSEFECEVIAIDKDITNVERVSHFCDRAIQADFTDIDQLRDCGLEEIDVAVVATGSLLEESIMGVMNLKELGVPYIVAKAKNKTYMQVLQKVGVDRVVRPEKEMGERVAKSLMSRNILDMIDIDDVYSIVEIVAPENWVGKTLKSLDVRSNFGVNVLAVRKKHETRFSLSPDAEYVIDKSDALLVIAETNKLERYDYLGEV